MSKHLLRVATYLAMLVFVATAGASEVHHFARAQAFAYASLSPDAAYVSFVRQIGAQQVVIVRERERGTESQTLSLEAHRERVRWCGWADNRYVLCGTVAPMRKQHAVRESTRLYAIDARTRRVRELNERLDTAHRDRVIDLLPARAERVLLQHDAIGRGYPEVSELNVVTGALRNVVRSHPPVRSWMSNGAGEVRLGVGYRNGVASLFVPSDTHSWTPVLEQDLSDIEAIAPLALGPEVFDLFALKHHQGRAALVRFDLSQRSPPEILLADPFYDIAGPVVVEAESRKLLAVKYLADAPTIHFFSNKERELYFWLDAQLPQVTNTILDRSLDGRHLLVSSESDVDPPSLYFVDVKHREIDLLGDQYPGLEGRAFSSMRAIVYAARDGQPIPSYLTLPVGPLSADLPAIVMPHGGPETRDVRGFNPLVQFLAGQGYAILQPNFRGSLGFGAGFAAAGAGQWGGVIHNDITDGARWLIEQKIADAERVCIVGSSFGGYAALLAATRESQWYACAASFSGVSDLLALVQSAQRADDTSLWQQRIGSDPRALLQMSPLSRVNLVEMPVLMMHGRSDAVVPVSQSRRFARSLREEGKPHRFDERADCDHDMTVESCRTSFFETLAHFLAESLSESRPP